MYNLYISIYTAAGCINHIGQFTNKIKQWRNEKKMEITFQNKSEDLDAFYDYLLAQTPEGIRLGKYGFQDKQRWIFIDSALLGTVVWGATGNGVLAIVAALGFFIFMEFLFLLFAGFKPHYFYGRKYIRVKKVY